MHKYAYDPDVRISEAYPVRMLWKHREVVLKRKSGPATLSPCHLLLTCASTRGEKLKM